MEWLAGMEWNWWPGSTGIRSERRRRTKLRLSNKKEVVIDMVFNSITFDNYVKS
jgi:hypothetical protein